MNLPEAYLGIAFSIRENGDGTCTWAVQPPMNAKHPENSAGIVPGGQNEAILAARKAIGLHQNATQTRTLPGILPR
jgi:hypothetical protein